MKIPARMVAVVVVLLAIGSRTGRAQDAIVTLSLEKKPVAEYIPEATPKKPYVRKLFTPAGRQLLLDGPADHLHHHGLMFACSVNGVNFWEEVAGTGTQQRSGVTVGQGLIVQTLEWIASDSKKVQLVERRSITPVVVPDSEARLLLWHCEFQTSEGQDTATLTGRNYNGLGMRFAKEFETEGAFHSDGKLASDNKLYGGGTWCAFSGQIEKQPAFAALIDLPGNPRPAEFFTMSKPFCYLSVTLRLDAKPLVIEKGKPVTLNYLVAYGDGAIDAKRIAALLAAGQKVAAAGQTGK